MSERKIRYVDVGLHNIHSGTVIEVHVSKESPVRLFGPLRISSCARCVAEHVDRVCLWLFQNYLLVCISRLYYLAKCINGQAD